LVSETCIVKDTPDVGPCGKPRHTTLTVAYTFSFPFPGRHLFEIDMCQDHAKAMDHRLKVDLANISLDT
jgi:hypothetical protein